LTTLPKTFEEVKDNRVTGFLNFNNILTEEKFGFRKGLSTSRALYKFRGKTLHALNDKIHVGDIRIFFCLLKHLIVWIMKHYYQKLNFYGIQGKAGNGLNQNLIAEN
jgi:hypothetical protein